jgi:hypothetical protein
MPGKASAVKAVLGYAGIRKMSASVKVALIRCPSAFWEKSFKIGV